MTQILNATQHPPEQIAAAAKQALEAGELVIFPTDTVYGLAARADDERAVEGVFAAKRRPADRPLPVLIASAEEIERVASQVSAVVRRLAAAFWPGPLTIVLPKSSAVPDWVTCGSEWVGVRVPDDPIALAILKACPFLVAVTSANLSDEPTPVTGQECASALARPVKVVVEAGPRTSKPSTVVRVEEDGLEILRHGPISRDQLEAAAQDRPT